MSQNSETSDQYIFNFISRNKEMLLSPEPWSQQVETSHLLQRIIKKRIAIYEYPLKSFSLDDVLNNGDNEFGEWMKRNGKHSVNLPVPKILFLKDGVTRFFSLCKEEPKYIDVKDWLLDNDLLSNEQELEIYKLFAPYDFKRKRGPKKKVYVRAWHIYLMARTLIERDGMSAYSNRKGADPQRYALDFIFVKLNEQGITNITRDDLINDYRKFNTIKFLHPE